VVPAAAKRPKTDQTRVLRRMMILVLFQHQRSWIEMVGEGQIQGEELVGEEADLELCLLKNLNGHLRELERFVEVGFHLLV